MKEVYKENTQIVRFLSKAQNKIADLSTFLVERGGDNYEALTLLLELSDFIECLDSCYCNWKEEDIIRWIHEYNHRANLNAIPYSTITGLNTIIVTGEGVSLPITVSDISDYISQTNMLIKASSHNSISNIQGGLPSERYHIDKQMYDYLYNLVHPIAPSTVSLQVLPNKDSFPSGYYELGTNISIVNLVASINYNYYKQASIFSYKRNSTIIASTVPAKLEQPNSIVDSNINSDTTYSFEATFPDGVKSDSRSIIFRQPMYYGVINKNQSTNASLLIQGTKDVRDRGEMTLTFNMPVGNTLITDNSYKVPYLFIPLSWGRLSSAYVGIFDFGNDWIDTILNMPLANGTSVPGIILIYNTQIEGITTFKINW